MDSTEASDGKRKALTTMCEAENVLPLREGTPYVLYAGVRGPGSAYSLDLVQERGYNLEIKLARDRIMS